MEQENETNTNNSLDEEKVILKEYKKLQDNSISKEKYEKDLKELKDKNELYLKAITEGASINADSENDDFDLHKGISDISKFKGTNLEYWKHMTKISDNLLKTLPESEITKIAGADGIEEIVKVNTIMKQMVNDSNGDADYFRTLYKQRVNDSTPRISADIEKEGGLINYLQKNNTKK